MYPIDTHFVINPVGGPLTPVEAAVVAYQAYRDDHPLPDGWTQSVLMISDLDVHFSIYLESADYLAVFIPPFWPDPHGGGLLVVFRKDGGSLTTLEATAVTHRLLHPYLAPDPDHCPIPVSFDGSIHDRPLSYSSETGRPDVGYEIPLQLSAGGGTNQKAHCQYPVPVTIARPPRNDPKAILAATNLLLKHEADRMKVVNNWIKQQHILAESALSGLSSA